MKKFFTLVFGVLFAMCANAATLEIGEPSNNVKDGDNVWYDAATKTIVQVGGLILRIALIMMNLFWR